ncbi:succinylglutamic semialdehyde dehydrogenase [Salmonella enterica subsp. enterica]|nr:succinylglutamic semialdehyde dehydrogenase [Salmonella enterica subsp. enterica]
MTLWINGDWITGQGERRRKTNPVSAEILWQGNDANAAQVAEACQAARAAFPRWARQPFAARQAIVEKFAALLEAHKAELTEVIARETGKPRWEAATEVTAMINKIAISIKAYHARTGEQKANLSMAPRRCAIVLTVCWRYSALITFPAIYRMAILCPRCWQAIR